MIRFMLKNIFNKYYDRLFNNDDEEIKNYNYFSKGIYYHYKKKNYNKAIKYYLMDIEAGNTFSIVELSSLYETCKYDYKNAEKYRLMAIEKCDVKCLLFVCYLCKRKINRESAIKYYLIAIEKKSVKAMCELAQYYKYMRSYNEAKKYYLMAGENGYYNAYNYVGEICCTIEKNYSDAKKYYLIAYENGCGNLYNLGVASDHNGDYEDAEKYYLMTIEENYITAPQAMSNLGYNYSENKEYEKAIKYYLMAIERNDCSAMVNLGIYYECIEKKYDEAKKVLFNGR